MSTDLEQVEGWKTESWKYFERNYSGKNLRDISVHPYVERMVSIFPLNIEQGSVLEIGCSPGSNLHWLNQRYNLRRVAGTEPSPRVTAALASVFPEMEFHDWPSQHLPARNGEFDLVLLRSVLHWVDRNYILQTLGEAMRVTDRWLLVSDFTPTHPYSGEYHHLPGLRTYKIDYRPLIEGSGFMRCVASFDHNQGDEWKVCRTSLYEKLAPNAAFPLRREVDFGAASLE